MMENRYLKNAEEIIATEHTDLICVDYFNTLVYRDTHEENMRRLWAASFSNCLQKDHVSVFSDVLYSLRLKAEKYSKEIFGCKYEATYESVMKLLYLFLDVEIPYGPSTFYQKALQCEIDIEMAHQIPNMEVARFLSEYKQKGMTIWLVSDFYLPQCAFHEFLSRLLFVHLIDEVFVSSDLDKRKSNGTMYEMILNKWHGHILMIGDNRTSDYLQPKKFGISSVWCPYSSDKKYYSKEYVGKRIHNVNKLNTQPFSNYSLILYLFTELLYKKLILNDESEVYFLSREGQYLKELFDFYLLNMECESIKTHYLCVSRFALDQVLNDNEQKMNFKKYIESLGVTQNTKRLVLVDIGWKGTMQDMLHKILPNTNIIGYYIGTTEYAVAEENSKKEGLIFRYYPQKSFAYDSFSYNTLLQEELLVANHGSVCKYNSNGLPEFEENVSSILNAFKALQLSRNEIKSNFKKYMELFVESGYMMFDFIDLCAIEYIKMTLNWNKEYVSARKKYKTKDQNIFKNRKIENDLGKLNILKGRISWLRKEKSEPISYFRLFELYSDKIHLKFFEPIIGKTIKLWQIGRIKKENRRKQKHNGAD